MNTTRWAICGTGKIAGKFADALGNVPDAELVAVASRTPGRAADFAMHHAVPRYHDSYEALADDDGVDVVYVANTQDAHLATTVLLAKAGRHVLCEKPIGLSSAELEQMIDAAERNQVFLMEALWSRFLPAYRLLGSLLADGAVGEIRLVEANFAIRVPDEAIDGHRLFDPDRGGGALGDLGIYPVQLAHLVLGEPTGVAAIGSFADQGVDEQVVIGLQHRNGAASSLFTSIVSTGSCAARIAGNGGDIHIDPMFHAPSRIRVVRDGDEQTHDVDPASLHYQVPEVQRCLREGLIESPEMPWSESRSIHRTLDAIRAQITDTPGASDA